MRFAYYVMSFEQAIQAFLLDPSGFEPLPRYLGETAHNQCEHDHRCDEQDDRSGRGSTARATAWPAERHRRRKLLRQRRIYTARKEASGVSPDVVSVLALFLHCTVGAMARTSALLR